MFVILGRSVRRTDNAFNLVLVSAEPDLEDTVIARVADIKVLALDEQALRPPDRDIVQVVQSERDAVNDCSDPVGVRRGLYIAPVIVVVGI